MKLQGKETSKERERKETNGMERNFQGKGKKLQRKGNFKWNEMKLHGKGRQGNFMERGCKETSMERKL